MKVVISVAKAYKHRGKRQHPRAKKHWFVYWYEYDEFEEQWYMKSKQVNWLQALYFRTQKRHRCKVTCTECGSVFIALIKSFREKLECHYCSS